VLRPGGRVGITDIVADDALTAAQRAERGSYAGCIAGALSFSEFRSGLEAVGLEDVSLTVSHQVVDGMYSVIVKANRPVNGTTVAPASGTAVDAVEGAARSSCCGGACCG